MSAIRRRIQRDERGASLVLAIVFMVVAGAIGAGLVTSVASGLHDTASLATGRNHDYAADGAVESSIVNIRKLATPGVSPTGCPYAFTQANGLWLDATEIQVDCSNTPSVALTSTGTVNTQNNVTFLACLYSARPCTKDNAIITALVNFQAGKTFVEAWSVNQ